MVSSSKLRVCHRLRDQKEGVSPDSTNSTLLVRAQFLLWVYYERPSTCTMFIGQEMDEEM